MSIVQSSVDAGRTPRLRSRRSLFNGPDMSHSPSEEARLVEPHVAHDLLSRAAKIDAEAESPYRLAHLREAAEEAGISDSAFEQALRHGDQGIRPAPPLWVRVCLSGVPSRRAAMVFFGGFFAAIPAVLGAAVAGLLPPASAVSIGILLAFAGWSTGEAVRWHDRRGWDCRE